MYSESQARLSESASSTPLLLTIPEVADELRVDKRTVYRLLRSGELDLPVIRVDPARVCDASTWSSIWPDSRPTRRKAQRLDASARRCCYDRGDACPTPGDERGGGNQEATKQARPLQTATPNWVIDRVFLV